MERPWRPTTAGIVSIVAGAEGLIGGIIVTVIGGMLGSLSSLIGSAEIYTALNILLAIGIPLIIFGIVAIVGGIYAIKRRIWGLALAGSILAILCSPILGIIAVIFVAQSKKEFSQRANQQ